MNQIATEQLNQLNELSHINFDNELTILYTDEVNVTQKYVGTVEIVGHDSFGNIFIILPDEVMIHGENLIGMYHQLHS